MKQPLLIALCGRPKSGKSTIQKILADHLGCMPFDDGEILRGHTMELLGLDAKDVYTQEGKAGQIMIDGTVRTVRWALGEMGNAYERTFGEHAIPNWAIRQARQLDAKVVTFGSVRKSQGWAYLDAGGLVVEVVRPNVPESPYHFDRYDFRAVTHTFHNDMPIDQMEKAVVGYFKQLIAMHYSEAA